MMHLSLVVGPFHSGPQYHSSQKNDLKDQKLVILNRKSDLVIHLDDFEKIKSKVNDAINCSKINISKTF